MKNDPVGMLKQAFTELDNSTIDIVRVGGGIAVISSSLSLVLFLVMEVVAFANPEEYTFDAVAFGAGLGAVLGSLGGFLLLMAGALRLKPEDPTQKTTTIETDGATVTTTDSTMAVQPIPPEQPRAKRGRQ